VTKPARVHHRYVPDAVARPLGYDLPIEPRDKVDLLSGQGLSQTGNQVITVLQLATPMFRAAHWQAP
jgi:hypothetical protein